MSEVWTFVWCEREEGDGCSGKLSGVVVVDLMGWGTDSSIGPPAVKGEGGGTCGDGWVAPGAQWLVALRQCGPGGHREWGMEGCRGGRGSRVWSWVKCEGGK